jgi:plastocyanin
VIVVAALALLILSAGSAAASTTNVTVGPSGFLAYDPDSVTITVGDTVHWTWDSSNHSTTSGDCNPCAPDGNWDSGVHNNGFTFDHTFIQVGVFHYYCAVHFNSMTGTVTVQATTAVGIRSFRAIRSPAGVVVRWTAGADARTLGFNVFRENAGTRRQLNRGLILATGSQAFVDRRAPRGEAAYWLQAVKLDGTRLWQGPVLAAR